MAPPTGPSPDEWEAVKTRIYRLYFDSTLNNVIEKMKADHGFFASKNQYERKLKEWDFRKNLSLEERYYAIRTVRKRKAEDKASQVKWQGVVLSDKKLKKLDSQVPLIGANVPANELALWLPRPDETISVCTPPPETHEVFCPRRQVQIDNLPFFRFLDIFENQGASNVAMLVLNKTDQNHCHTIMNSTPPEYEICEDYDSDLIGAFGNEIWSPNSHVITLPDQVIFNFFCARVELQALPTSRIDRVDLVLNNVKSVMVERDEGFLRRRVEKLLSPIDQEAFLECLSFFIYFFSNCLHVNDKQDPRRFTEIIEHVVYQPKHALRQVLALKDPTLLSFMHSILTTAWRTGNLAAGRALLEADCDRVLFHGRSAHLLYTVVKFQHIDILKELIQEGADVNVSIGTKERPKTILSVVRDIDCFDLLNAAGVRLDEQTVFEYRFFTRPVTPIHGAIFRNDTALVQRFLEAGASVHFLEEEDAYSYPDARHVLHMVIRSDNGSMVKSLLEAGALFQGKVLIAQYPVSYIKTPFPSILHFAVFSGSINVVKELLENKWYSDLVTSEPYGWSLLRDAARNGDSDMVAVLFSAGADVNSSSEPYTQKYTRVHDGVDFGLEYKLPSYQSEGEEEVFYGIELAPSTALMAAVEAGHVEVIQLLIEHHVDIHTKALGYHGSFALESAQVLGHRDIVNILVQHGASRPHLHYNENRGRELVSAIKRHDLDRARELIRIGTEPTLIIAYLGLLKLAHQKYYGRDIIPLEEVGHMFSFLLECGCDINFRDPQSDKSLFEIAFSRMDFDAAKNLILEGVDVGAPLSRSSSRISIFDYAVHQFCRRFRGGLQWSDSCRTSVEVGLEVLHMMVNIETLPITKHSIYEATTSGDLELLQKVIRVREKAGRIDPGELYRSLGPAVRCPNKRIFAYLVSIGASVNEPASCTGRFETPLHAASSVGDLEMVKQLLDMGAIIDLGGTPDVSALQDAAFCGKIDVVAFLLEKGADVNACPDSFDGGPALMRAIAEGHLEIARLLLEFGANVNTEIKLSPYGKTNALGYAVEYGRLDAVQLLLNTGADSYDRAIEIALERGELVIADLIQDWKEKKEREASANDPWGSSEL